MGQFARLKEMSLRVRKFSADRDYQLVASWWNAQPKWTMPIPISALSRFGLVTELDGQPICAAWLYSTDSSIAWLEFLVSDPNTDKTIRSEAVNVLIENLAQEAKDQGFTFLFTSSGFVQYTERLENLSFKKTDEQVTHLFRRLL
jgi:hypothetical protein